MQIDLLSRLSDLSLPAFTLLLINCTSPVCERLVQPQTKSPPVRGSWGLVAAVCLVHTFLVHGVSDRPPSSETPCRRASSTFARVSAARGPEY